MRNILYSKDGVEVTVTTNLTEQTTTINVAAKVTGGALNTEA